MYRLPGHGGTVRMNARCYGGEISQVCSAVTVVTKDGKIKTYDSTEKFFVVADTYSWKMATLFARLCCWRK